MIVSAPERERARCRLVERIAAAGVVDAELVRQALAEELAPLLHARGCTAATPEVAETLRRAHAVCVARNLVAARALARLAEVFDRAGIPGVLLKGAALLRLVYRTPGERPMNDVDVMVPPERFEEAMAAAGTVGRLVSGRPDRPITERHAYVRSVAIEPGAVIEIHRGIAPRFSFRLGAAGVFARARRDADGLYLPDATDLFVMLAAHATKHGFVLPFRAVVDGLFLAPQVDPHLSAQRAIEWRARPALAAWLAVLHRFGLRDAAWQPVRDQLGRGARARAAAVCRHLPLAEDSAWRRTLRIAFLLEGVRGGAYVAERTALRLVDHLLHG